jgi:hypothetical protein
MCDELTYNSLILIILFEFFKDPTDLYNEQLIEYIDLYYTYFNLNILTDYAQMSNQYRLEQTLRKICAEYIWNNENNNLNNFIEFNII